MSADTLSDIAPAAHGEMPPTPSVSPAARPFLAAIRWYQIALEGRPSPCRFVPSCSAYAVEALQVHGAIRGSALAVRRLCRCHPWGSHGYDPVPEKKAPDRCSS
jgi:putative membrane protein insertion efficiency factor